MTTKTSFSFTSLFILGLLVQISFAQFQRTYQNCAVISPRKKFFIVTILVYDFYLYWTINGNSIQVGIQSNAPNGYMSIGMSRVASTMDSGKSPKKYYLL